MTDGRRAGSALVAVALSASLCAACASDEERLRAENKDLRYDVAAAKQRNEDLHHRMRLAEARNRVLAQLVRGLTAASEPGAAASGGDEGLGPAHQSLAALDRELEELASTLQKSGSDLRALRAQREAMQHELSASTRAIEHARAQEAAANQRVVAFRELLLRFRATTEAGNLKVRVAGNRMLLELPDALLFDRGNATVKPSGRALLDQVADALIAVGDRQFQVTGHAASGAADRGGGYASAWELSAARAIHVTEYLIKRGVPKYRLSAAAYADIEPIVAATAEESQRRSRRIEIVLLPQLNELPDAASMDRLLEERTPTSEPASPAGEPEPTTEPEPAAAPEPAAEPEPAAAPEPAAPAPAPAEPVETPAPKAAPGAAPAP